MDHEQYGVSWARIITDQSRESDVMYHSSQILNSSLEWQHEQCQAEL